MPDLQQPGWVHGAAGFPRLRPLQSYQPYSSEEFLGRRSGGNYCGSFPGNSSSHPPCAHRLAGGRETLWWGARLVPCTASGVHFQPRGPCTEPEGSPPSQDCQTTAGGTADLAVFWEESPELKDKMFLHRAGPGIWPQRPSVHQELDLLKPKDDTKLPVASPRPPFFVLCAWWGDFQGLCTGLWEPFLIGKGTNGA